MENKPEMINPSQSKSGRGISLFGKLNLRVKLYAAFLFVTLLAVLTVSVVTLINMRRELTTAAYRTLDLAGLETGKTLDQYIQSLMDLLEFESDAQSLSLLLTLPKEQQNTRSEVGIYLRILKAKNAALEYLLVDRNGRIVAHSDYENTAELPNFTGFDPFDRDNFKLSIFNDTVYVSSPYFPRDGGEARFYVGAEVEDSQGYPVGMLLAGMPLARLQEILDDNKELGGIYSFPVLLDELGLRLAHGGTEDALYKLVAPIEAEKASVYQESGRLPNVDPAVLSSNIPALKAGLLNINDQPYFSTAELGSGDEINAATVRRLNTQRWYIVYMQPNSVFLAPVEQQLRLTLILTGVMAGISLLAALFTARQIANPILRLRQVAEEVAGGDLGKRAPVETQDETGMLAVAFNAMTDQLAHTLEGLEQRIEERTVALKQTLEQMEYRANRLQMVADVTHTITSIQDLDELLNLVCQSISARFGYYHVGIFLSDIADEYAILNASNSEGGRKMLERGHKLKIGEIGMVGFVTGTGQARIASDVGKDAVYFDNPNLPDTRSEMTLPLKAGNRIIGALDVQSTDPNAFSENDITLLSTLADQVAMAIENARLFGETRRTLNELQAAQRTYLQQEWGRMASERHQIGYRFAHGKFDVISAETTMEMPRRDMIGEEANKLVVPIKLRGEVIGSLSLLDPEDERQWSGDEVDLAESVADQVGVALETARLLEVTERRAERERLVAEITTRMRTSNKPEQIMQTAIDELRKALQVRDVHVRIQPIVNDQAQVDKTRDPKVKF